MPFLIIAGVIILIVLIAYISISNNLNRSVVKIEEAESGIDVALTKRFDVLTKMLDVTKAYAAHERETIKETINLRSGMSMAERSEANGRMNEAFGTIIVVAEAYPELKSSENLRQLQVAVADTEEHLQAARRVYNSNVSAYNQAIVSFPGSVVANIKHMGPKEFFEAESAKRKDVDMKF